MMLFINGYINIKQKVSDFWFKVSYMFRYFIYKPVKKMYSVLEEDI